MTSEDEMAEIGRDPLSYMGSPDSTEEERGIIELASVAEAVAGTNTDKAVTPAGLAAVAIAGAPNASTTQKGIIEIATNGEAVAGIATDLAIVASNLSAVFASPPGIGSTSPAAGAFTTLSATGAFSLSGDQVQVSEGGTGLATITDHGIMVGSGTGAVTPLAVGTDNQILIGQTGADPIWSNNVDIPGTLDVTGATTLDDTLDVAGATTITAALTVNSLVVDNVTYDADAITSSSSLDIDAAGALQINSSGGIISIGNDAVAQNINLGTGAAARTIAIGNVTGATALNLRLGTGNFTLDGVGGSTYTIGASTTTGTISIGGTAQTGTMTIAGGTGAQTINIANSTGGKTVAIATGAGANAVTIGSTNTTSATTIQAGSGGITLTGDVSASGDVSLTTAGSFIAIEGGAATDFIGTATLTAGTVTVANTNIGAADRILLSRRSINGSTALGSLTYSISAATSFTITAVQAGTPAATETNDVSIIDYVIVRQL